MVAALLSVSTHGAVAVTPEVSGAIKAALSWHFRWIESPPSAVINATCSVALFERRSLVHCAPTSTAIEIEHGASSTPRAAYIEKELAPFEKALRMFRRNRSNLGSPVGAIERIAIPVAELGTCTVDSRLTTAAPSEVLDEVGRSGLLARGYQIWYPVICQGDPFYLVYFLSRQHVEWIWLYEIVGDRFELRWSYDAGSQQRRIPKRAIDSLAKKELWYKIDGDTR